MSSMSVNSCQLPVISFQKMREWFARKGVLRRFGIGLPLQYLLNSGWRLAFSG